VAQCKGGNFCLRFRKARALVSWLYHFSAHLRKVLTASSAPAVLLSSSIMNPVAIYHFLLKVSFYIVIFVVSMMKWRFREGKFENFVHTHPQQGCWNDINSPYVDYHPFKSYPFQTLFELGYPNLNSATVNCWVWWQMCSFFKKFYVKGAGWKI